MLAQSLVEVFMLSSILPVRSGAAQSRHHHRWRWRDRALERARIASRSGKFSCAHTEMRCRSVLWRDVQWHGGRNGGHGRATRWMRPGAFTMMASATGTTHRQSTAWVETDLTC